MSPEWVPWAPAKETNDERTTHGRMEFFNAFRKKDNILPDGKIPVAADAKRFMSQEAIERDF